MNDWHELFGNLRISPLCDRHMVKTVRGESCVAAPIIGDNSGARHHDAFQEAAERIGTPIRHQSKPDASGIAATPSRNELSVGLSLPYLNSRSHKSLMMNASSLAARTTTYPGFIRLDVFSRFSTESGRTMPTRSL